MNDSSAAATVFVPFYAVFDFVQHHWGYDNATWDGAKSRSDATAGEQLRLNVGDVGLQGRGVFAHLVMGEVYEETIWMMGPCRARI